MQYKTHIKIGKAFTLVAIAGGFYKGLFPAVDLSGDTRPLSVSLMELGVSVLIAYKAGVWGAEYPDIDHPTSTPAHKNPLLHRLMMMFNIKHRGKFTHSVDSVILTFLSLYMLFTIGIPSLTESALADVSAYSKEYPLLLLFSTEGLFTELLGLFAIYAGIGALSHLAGDLITTEGIRFLFMLPKVKVMPSNLSIFGWKPFKGKFNTGTHYEEMVYGLFNILVPVTALLMAFSFVAFGLLK